MPVSLQPAQSNCGANDFDRWHHAFCHEFEVRWSKLISRLGIESGQVIFGSRLRPSLVYWAGALVGFDLDGIAGIVDVALGIEAVHKASLILDDWIDGDQTRDGFEALHVSVGQYEAVIQAIRMLSLPERVAHETGSASLRRVAPVYLEKLNLLKESMAFAQIKELREFATEGVAVSDKDVSDIVFGETISIISFAFEMGLRVASGGKCSDEAINEVTALAMSIGEYFQLTNDAEALLAENNLSKSSANYDVNIGRKNSIVGKTARELSCKEVIAEAVANGAVSRAKSRAEELEFQILSQINHCGEIFNSGDWVISFGAVIKDRFSVWHGALDAL